MNDTQKQILSKMINKDIIGKRHILNETLKHSLPRQQRGKFNENMKELCRQGYVTKKTTKHGEAFAIPPCKVAEIRKILGL